MPVQFRDSVIVFSGAGVDELTTPALDVGGSNRLLVAFAANSAFVPVAPGAFTWEAAPVTILDSQTIGAFGVLTAAALFAPAVASAGVTCAWPAIQDETCLSAESWTGLEQGAGISDVNATTESYVVAVDPVITASVAAPSASAVMTSATYWVELGGGAFPVAVISPDTTEREVADEGAISAYAGFSMADRLRDADPTEIEWQVTAAGFNGEAGTISLALEASAGSGARGYIF